MRKKILTDYEIQEITTLYKQSINILTISKMTKIHHKRIRDKLKELGIFLSTSDLAKLRVGPKNTFYGKKHSEKTKKKHSEFMKTRLGKLNPNYRHGNYQRRPRDYKIAEFKPVRNLVFKRDNYTCQITKIKGGTLHAHHLLPYWVCPEAYLDIENLITVSNNIHLKICHNGDWAKFNMDIIPDSLITKYKLDRERLTDLAGMHNAPDVIVRTSDIHKTEEINRND